MASEYELRDQLATCTRIFAMQGMIGVFGHVSVYQPETKTVFITPGMGSDKGSLRAEEMVPCDLTASRSKANKVRRSNGRFTLPPRRAPGCACRSAPAHALCDAFHHRQAQISARHAARCDL